MVVECILIAFGLRLGWDMVYEMATWNNEKGGCLTWYHSQWMKMHWVGGYSIQFHHLENTHSLGSLLCIITLQGLCNSKFRGILNFQILEAF